MTTLQLHVGGGDPAQGAGSGIHWHVNLDNRIEYIATDAQRQVIPWVKLTDRTGKVHRVRRRGHDAGGAEPRASIA